MTMNSKTVLFFLILALLVCGCVSDEQKRRHEEQKRWFQSDGRIKILSTTGMINDIVEQIGGEHVHGHVLIDRELDPHAYQLVKGDDEKLAFANLIFYNGLGLEHGPSLRETLSENENAVSLGDRIRENEPELILTYDGQVDPHIWMDISLWEKTVPIIVETLSKHDPKNAAYFRERAEHLQGQMQEQHRQVKEVMENVPEERRFLVTSHDAFNYFTRAYMAADSERADETWQKRFAAPEGLAPDSQLSTTDIQLIIDHLARYQIHVLFPECNVSQDSINKILQAGKEIGLEIHATDICLYSDSMGPERSGGETYLKMVLYNARQIANHLNQTNHASNAE